MYIVTLEFGYVEIILITGIYIECLPIVPDHHAGNNDFLYLQTYQKISVCLYNFTHLNILDFTF